MSGQSRNVCGVAQRDRRHGPRHVADVVRPPSEGPRQIDRTSQFRDRIGEAAGIDPIRSGQIAAGIALQAGTTTNLAVVERALAKTALLSKTLDAVDELR